MIDLDAMEAKSKRLAEILAMSHEERNELKKWSEIYAPDEQFALRRSLSESVPELIAEIRSLRKQVKYLSNLLVDEVMG